MHRLPVFIAMSAVLCSRFFMGTAHCDDSELAAELVQRIGVNRGLVAMVGEDDVAVDIARASELLLHVREPSGDRVRELQAKTGEAGLRIDRLVVEQGTLETLPYASNIVDAVISTRAADLMGSLSAKEVLRALRPGGVAIIGTTRRGENADVDADMLKDWASVADAVTRMDEFGTWIQFTKPVPAGIDEWTHWEKSADNNPVSQDSVIKAPYMTR